MRFSAASLQKRWACSPCNRITTGAVAQFHDLPCIVHHRPESGHTLALVPSRQTCSSSSNNAVVGSMSKAIPSTCPTWAFSIGSSQVRNTWEQSRSGGKSATLKPLLLLSMTACGCPVSNITAVPLVKGIRWPVDGKCKSKPRSSLKKRLQKDIPPYCAPSWWYLAPRQAIRATSQAVSEAGRPSVPVQSDMACTHCRYSGQRMRARAKGKASTSPGASLRRCTMSRSQSAASLAGGAGTLTVPTSTTLLTLRLRMASPLQK